jgi:hypothetical protein
LNARVTTVVLAVVLLPMSVRATQKEIETPQGSFRWKELPDTKLATFVRELIPEEAAALNRDADRATQLIDKYVPPAKRHSDLLENLDAAFGAWHSSRAADRESAMDIIRITGAAYGRYCIQRLGLRWAITRDDHGTDTALVRDQPPTRAFPFSSIEYRIEDEKTDFFVALYVGLKHTIDDGTQ